MIPQCFSVYISVSLHSLTVSLKAGSQTTSHNDAKPCVTLIHCIINMICFLRCCQTQHNIMRIGSDSVLTLVALHWTNQFSEFYQNATDTIQGFATLCEPSLSLSLSLSLSMSYKHTCFSPDCNTHFSANNPNTT